MTSRKAKPRPPWCTKHPRRMAIAYSVTVGWMCRGCYDVQP